MNQTGTVLCLYKEIGETPLECLERFRKGHPEYTDAKLSYAGRLDPMAEGLLLVLVGEANKRREEYLCLDKTYECEVLLGVSTDSFDLLGLVQNIHNSTIPVNWKDLERVVKSLEGKREMEYPPFSSKTVEGKSLWQWAREERLDEVNLPTRAVELKSIELEAVQYLSKNRMINHTINRIDRVRGDFRQDEIIQRWEQVLSESDIAEFPVVELTIECSSGTYIRRLADTLGRQLETGACAFSIKRTRIGNYSLDCASS